MLDVWVALPLVTKGRFTRASAAMANVIDLLEDSNRVYQIDLTVTTSRFEGVLAAMRVPFPELTDLWFSVYRTAPAVPDSLLGVSPFSSLGLDFNSFARHSPRHTFSGECSGLWMHFT